MQDSRDPLDGESAVTLIRARRERGKLHTWFESDAGRLLAVVTNGERAMVMLLREPRDAGEHAIDRSAGESMSGGYVIDNGQVDTYADRDTVPLAMAMELVTAVIEGRERSPRDWQTDR
jgi:hypothetical protein